MPKYVTIPTVGDTVNDQYVLGEVIGEGAFGKVYEARQIDLDRRVAVKILHPRIATHEQIIERFKREATVASSLRHRNSVTILEYGVFGGGEGAVGLPFIAMEFLDGQDLAAYLKGRGKLPLDEALFILHQAVSSLAEAHDKGIIHRDIKPQNLFICTQKGGAGPFVKVLDFGIAKMINDAWGSEVVASLTKTGAICGTPAYMAPEQAAGSRDLTATADIYSLGCIAFELLTGAPPFTASNPMTVALKHMTEPVPLLPAPFVGSGIDELVQRALAKAPEDRFPDAAALLEALDKEMAANRVASLPTSEAVAPGPAYVASDLELDLEHRSTISLESVPALVVDALEAAPTFQMDLDPAQFASLGARGGSGGFESESTVLLPDSGSAEDDAGEVSQASASSPSGDLPADGEAEPTVLLMAPAPSDLFPRVEHDLAGDDDEPTMVTSFDSMPTHPIDAKLPKPKPSLAGDDDEPTKLSFASPLQQAESPRTLAYDIDDAPKSEPARAGRAKHRLQPAAVEKRREEPQRDASPGPTAMSASPPSTPVSTKTSAEGAHAMKRRGGGGSAAFVVAIVLLCLGGLAAVGVAAYFGADLLAPASEASTVYLVSEPQGAVVVVDGQELGVTPLNLPVSRKSVLVRKDGFTDAQRDLVGHGGETLTVVLDPAE